MFNLTTIDYLLKRAKEHSFVRGRGFDRFERRARESFAIFQAAKFCQCQNLDCECGSYCWRENKYNVDPRSSIEHLGPGSLCARCCENMPSEYHRKDCRCDKCTRRIEAEDNKLRQAFKVETYPSMDWVEDSERTYLRRRVERAPVATSPVWYDH